jgi:hypothetical protein
VKRSPDLAMPFARAGEAMRSSMARYRRWGGKKAVTTCLTPFRAPKGLDGRISAPAQGGIDAFQHEVVDRKPFIEGDLP